jgi:hypothetical protein
MSWFIRDLWCKVALLISLSGVKVVSKAPKTHPEATLYREYSVHLSGLLGGKQIRYGGCR